MSSTSANLSAAGQASHHLAIDLGAESGRLMLGTLADKKISLEELHRFPNTPVRAGDSLRWDIDALFAEVKVGLRKAAARNVSFASISTDSWGVDYVLCDAAGEMIRPTFHYRDPRSAVGIERVRAKISWLELFGETGIQFIPLNTIYQLASEEPDRLARARTLLPIADAFNYFLCGVARAEESFASTTQLYNPRTRDWSPLLLEKLGLPRELFPPVVFSGTVLGEMKTELAREVGLEPIPVIASCSHDTAAAVAAVPGQGDDWAYLSSGTWSLLGVELASPLLSAQCREFNLTNEIGFGGSVRLLKNIVGLWLVQECRREWARAGTDFDYGTLMRLAAEAPPFISLINPEDPRFLAPGDMPRKIAGFCRETGQPVPDSPGAVVRCALESLAMNYARVFAKLEQLTGRKFTRLHIVGGGSRNELLNQFTANALNIPVLAGPVEATALGNVLVQAIALGRLPSLVVARQWVANSFPFSRYEPRDHESWRQASRRIPW